MSKSMQRMAVVAASTMSSRIAGLLRDILIFAAFGAGRVNDAFVLAFTFPNLFRRLLGEGAMTSALIPLLAKELKKGRAEAFSLLNQVSVRLVPVLVGLSLLFGLIFGGTLLLGGEVLPEKWRLASVLGILLIPYLVFICFAAAITAVLQVLDRFAVAALTPLILNLCMIGALGGVGWWVADTAEGRVYWLCGGVLVGGALQLILPALALRREGWRPRKTDFKPNLVDARLSELWRLLLPGLAGAAVLQMNILVSRVIAFQAAPDGASLVYLANRLMELPLGVFTISVTTVIFPALSRWAASGDRQGFCGEFWTGLRLILAIMLPAACGLAFLAEPLVRLLFEWGAFDAEDVRRSVPIVVIYALGLPLYALATLLVRSFHARGDMQTPLRVSLWNLAINAGLSLALVVPLGIAGVALANVLAALVQCSLLGMSLWKRVAEGAARQCIELAKVVLGVGAMLILLAGLWPILASWSPESFDAGGKAVQALRVSAMIFASVAVYGLLLWLMRFRDFGPVLKQRR